MTDSDTFFWTILRADGRSPELADAPALYDWLIGSWVAEVIDVQDDGTPRSGPAEIHFAWVLEGRAIQDLWIAPPRALRSAGLPQKGNRFGTSLRVYDPALGAWRVTWINPVTLAHDHLIGRKEGDDIVQEGRREDGTLTRWSFREITPDSFHWFGEGSTDEGKTWQLQAEFKARRGNPRLAWRQPELRAGGEQA
jgi:hypothetical protein